MEYRGGKSRDQKVVKVERWLFMELLLLRVAAGS